MNAAELDTRRRALGLNIAETAEVIGAGVRTVSYWLAGDGEPRSPDEIAARLTEVEVAMGDWVDSCAEAAIERAADTPGPVVIRRYRLQADLDNSDDNRGLPLGAHAMAVAWLLDDLRADGHEVSVQWS